jgi:hypothetical protein
MNGRRSVLADLRECLFLDRSHHHLEALRPGSIKNQERKFAVAGDKAKFFVRSWHEE